MMNEITNRFEQLIESRSWKIAKQELATLEPFQMAKLSAHSRNPTGYFCSGFCHVNRPKRLSNTFCTTSRKKLSKGWQPMWIT